MHFCVFVRLCVVLALWHALAPCMVHGIGVHVMHHIIIMFIMFIMFIMMMIVDHHRVHHSLFIDQSLNDDH